MSVRLSAILSFCYLQERRRVRRLPLPSQPRRGCPSHPEQEGSELPRCGLLISSKALRWMLVGCISHTGTERRERDMWPPAVIGFIMEIRQPSAASAPNELDPIMGLGLGWREGREALGNAYASGRANRRTESRRSLPQTRGTYRTASELKAAVQRHDFCSSQSQRDKRHHHFSLFSPSFVCSFGFPSRSLIRGLWVRWSD